MAQGGGETKIRVPREVIGTLRRAYDKSNWYEISARQSGDKETGKLHHECVVAYGVALRHLRQVSDDPEGTQWQ